MENEKSVRLDLIKEEIRAFALDAGADVCGFCGVGKLASAPEGFRPTDLFPDCRSVVAVGIALPKGMLRVQPHLLYAHCNELTMAKIDSLLLQLAGYAEKRFGAACVPVPCDTPYEFWDADTKTGKGLLSMKHAAVACGLGQLGKSTMLLNPVYGNRLTVGVMLADLELPDDVPCENICLPACDLCVKNCPVGAIGDDGVCQKQCREHAYSKTDRGFDTVDCNLCRSICPMRDGLPRRVEI